MLLPLGFVENLENLKENSSSILYLLKVKDLCEHLLQRNEELKNVTSDISKLGNMHR